MSILIQPKGSVSKEINRQSIARIYGMKIDDVGYINKQDNISSFKVLYSEEDQQMFERGTATGVPTSWSITNGSLQLTTSDGVFVLDRQINVLDFSEKLDYYITLEMFDDGTDSPGFYDKAIDAACAYAVANNYPEIHLSNKVYKIQVAHNIPHGITFRGTRSNKFQQGSATSTQFGSTIAYRAANPLDSAFLWYGAPGNTIWFNCGQLCTFDGITFGAPLQNFLTTTLSGVIDYGTSIYSLSYLNVMSCVYYGMTNFVVSTGASQYFLQNNGFAMQRDYQISNSRDLTRFEKCHANPNVIRPSDLMLRTIINDNRVFITLNNHDGTHIHDCHTFGFRKAIVNKCDSSYLGNLTIDMCMFDRTGCFIDNDTANAASIAISNSLIVGQFASTSGSATPDPDAGYVTLRKSSTQYISTMTFTNCSFHPAKLPEDPVYPPSSKPPYLINFQTTEGYVVNLGSLDCPEPTDNGAGTFCLITGTSVNGTHTYPSDPMKQNMVPNAGWADRHPINSIPRGWTFTNCSVSTNVGKRVTSNGTGASFGISFRQWCSTRTYVFSATAIGNSTGVNVTGQTSAGVVTNVNGSWTRKGGKYYCEISMTTSDLFHTISIDPGTGTFDFEYVAMIPGSVLVNTIAYSERQLRPIDSGVGSYSTQLNAGQSHSIYTDHAGQAGSYHLYISSVIGVMTCRLVKMTPTSVPTITIEDQIYAGTNTFGITWPDNSTPTITSTGAGLLFLTITGASYSTKVF